MEKMVPDDKYRWLFLIAFLETAVICIPPFFGVKFSK